MGAKLNFVVTDDIDGTPFQTNTFAQDIQNINELMVSEEADRVVVIVDDLYFQWVPIQSILKLPPTVWGVNLTSETISFVRASSPIATFAHELAHSFGVNHSSFTGLGGSQYPISDYSEKNLDGYDSALSIFKDPEVFKDFMWASGKSEDQYWIHKNTYNDLVQKLFEDKVQVPGGTTDSLQICAFLSFDDILSDITTVTIPGGLVSGSDPIGSHSVVALSQAGEVISETKFTPSFTLEPFWDDLETEFNPIVLDKTPILLNIPKIVGIVTLQVRSGDTVLEEIVVPSDNLTLLEAINHIPNLGFKEKPAKSRQSLITLAQKIEIKITDHEYNKAIDLLKNLKHEAKKLIRNHYDLHSGEISKKEFITLIRRENHRVKILKRSQKVK